MRKEAVPYLSVSNAAAALPFYNQLLGVEPAVLLNMPDGRVMHAEYRFEGGRLYLSEELPEHGGTPSPQTLGATSVAIHLYVEDCDALVAKMRELGSEVLMEPVDMFWGERFARVRDPFGHEWGVTTKLRDMTPQEIEAAAAALFAGEDSSTS
jgi:PhnB protein